MGLSKDPEKRETQLNNLQSFKKGVSGNPKGRPKGLKNWSSIVQQLLADEKLIDKVVSKKPAYWDDLPTKNGANAIVVAMMIRAMQGEQKAADWLRKTGFGDKLIHDFEEGFFEKSSFNINIVEPKHSKED